MEKHFSKSRGSCCREEKNRFARNLSVPPKFFVATEIETGWNEQIENLHFRVGSSNEFQNITGYAKLKE